MTTKLTTELQHGDRVLVNERDIVRTVSHVSDSGHVNARNKPLLTVHWLEGRTPEWSEGNTVTETYEWTLGDTEVKP